MKMRVETAPDRRGKVMFKVQFEYDDGKVSIKTLDYDSFMALMTKSAVEESYIPIGDIPSGYVDATFARYDTFRLILKAPAQKRLMIYSEGHFWIPFPGCLFSINVYHGNLKEISLYSYTDTEITYSTKLYRYPFGNVSADGRVCMGNIYLKDLSFNSADKVVDAFFSGKTNNDYYGDQNIKPKYSLSQLIHKLEKKETFPKRWLVKQGELTYAVLKDQILE